MKKIYGMLILGLALTPSFLFAYTSGSIFEVTNSTNAKKFTIFDSGNVGIGTTSPTQKFTVAGNVLADSYLEYSPIYIGDAISSIRNIRALPTLQTGDWREVDHNSLPEGVKYTENIIVPAVYDKNDRVVTATSSYLFTGRNMSKQVELNLRAIQQLITENDNLKARITALENHIIIK